MKKFSLLIVFVGYSLVAEPLPSDFSLLLKDGGGMFPRSETLLITNKECKYTFWGIVNGKQVNQDTKFKMSKPELENLYKILKENHFNQITAEDKGHVHDRGGITVEVKSDGNTVNISNAYSSFIEEKWMKNWNEIVKHLQQIMAQQQKKTISN